jgi:hypothetical protein
MAKLPIFCQDGLFLKDDFYSNDGIADTTLGELRWEIDAITGAGTVSYVAGADANTFGVARDTTDGTAAHGSAIRLAADGLILGPAGGFFRFKARIPATLAGNNLRVGLQNTVTATDSTVGIWVDMLAGVVTVQADSSHGDNTLTPVRIPSLTGGTTMVVATWHEFEVSWSGENAQGGPKIVNAYIDGHFAGSIPCEIDNDETMELSITHWDTSAGTALGADLDYVELFLARQSEKHHV